MVPPLGVGALLQTAYSAYRERRYCSPPPKEDEMHYILNEEEAEAVKGLKKGKSPGIDNINGEMIQAGGESYRRDTQNLQSDMAGRENIRGMSKISHRHNTKERRLGRMQQLQDNCSVKSHG